jgi:hypothetical protein
MHACERHAYGMAYGGCPSSVIGVHLLGVIGVIGVHVLGVIGVVGVHVLGVIGVIGVHVLGVIGVSAKTCHRTGCWQCRGYLLLGPEGRCD